MFITEAARDYPDDMPYENGNYWHRGCAECGEPFVGGKYRVVCRQCMTAPTPRPSPFYRLPLPVQAFVKLLGEIRWFENPGVIGWTLFAIALAFFVLVNLA